MSDRDRNQRDRGRAPKRELSPGQDESAPQRIRQESNYSRDNNRGYRDNRDDRGNRDNRDNRDFNRDNNRDDRGNRDNRDFNRDNNRDQRDNRGGYNNNNNRNQYNEDRNNNNNNRYDRDQSRHSNYSERGGGNGGGGGGNRGGYNNGNNRGGNGGYGGGGGGGFGGASNAQDHPKGEIQLQSNFFEVSSRGEWVLYQYHINFNPEVNSKSFKCGLLSQHYETLFKNSKAFDGGATIFSMTKLPEESTRVVSQSKKDGSLYNIKIDFIKEIHPGDDVTIQIFNIIFRRCLKRCNLKEFGKDRAYFDFNRTQKIDMYGLEIASGYKTSIEIYNGKLLLCSEVANRLINSKSVLREMTEICDRSRDDSYREDVEKRLIGMTVITNYNKKTYKIDDIAWDAKPTDRFQTRSGEISFQEYYKKQYQLDITNLSQPLLVSRPRERDIRRGQTGNILLIPEFCAITGQILIDPRNFKMKQDIEKHTKLNPRNRCEKLIKFLDTIKRSREAQDDFNNWQMDLDNDLVTLNGKVLEQVHILFGDQKVEYTANGWDNELKRAKHFKTNQLNNWCIFFGQRDQEKADLLKTEIPAVANSMGFRVSNPKLQMLPNTRDTRIFASEISNYIKSCQNQKPEMILCILPSNDKTLYSILKQTLCVQNSIPSQCVTQNIIDRNKMGKTKSVITKVAVQMSAKLGGEIWSIKVPIKMMVIGIDMYRDSSNRNEAALAFVASMNGDDKNLSRYYSRVIMQGHNELFANNLQMLMEDTLKNYLNKNNYLPERILIYRDGASDAQLRNILEFEINNQIRVAFKSFNEYEPKLTVFVVQKRGSTRFFYRSNGDITNPPIGTVIDNTVTGRKVNQLRVKKRDSTDGTEHSPRLERYNHNNQEVMKDFYLVSQSVRFGTVTPSHFRILLNENEDKLTDDRLQVLTYMFNHCYYNWPGQIRVPAPCHYAHKLAHLVGESLHRSHDPALDNFLYYL